MNGIFHNGQFHSEDSVNSDLPNRGLMYGDGCFDTQRSYDGKLFLPEAHYDQLESAMDYLGIKAPFNQKDYIHFLRDGIEMVESASNRNMIIRTQIWRKGGRGYSDHSSECEWIITFSDIRDTFAHPVSLSTTSVKAIPEQALSRKFKLSNGLNYILAARSATTNADDVVMETTDGFVSETTIANIFWIKKATIYTPSLNCDCYPGITRNVVVDLLDSLNLRYTTGSFKMSELLSAESVFVTNSVAGLRPVKSINDHTFKTDHELYGRILDAFQTYLKTHLV